MNIARMGRWGRIFALVVAAVALGAAHPKERTASPAQNKPHQAAAAAENPPLKQQAESDQTEKPCTPGHDNRSSDLCAQWKAADSAKYAADIALWIGIAGSLLGAATLFVAVKAALYAKEAARHTETGAKATAASADHAARAAKAAVDQNRAWLKFGEITVSDMIYRKVTANDVDHEYVAATFHATIVNVGATPATRVAFQPQIWAFPYLANYSDWWIMWERAVAEFQERYRFDGDRGSVLFPQDSITRNHGITTNWNPVEGSFAVDATSDVPIRLMGIAMVIYHIANGDEAHTAVPFLLDPGIGEVLSGKSLAEVGVFPNANLSIATVDNAQQAT